MSEAELEPYKLLYERVVSYCETLKKIQEFVEGELVVILETIADVEYKAASTALQNVKLARRPKDQVLLAIGHLQSAHTASREIYASQGWKDNFRFLLRATAVQKDLFTLSLMAICYRYMGEPALMQHTLHEASNAMTLAKTLDYDQSYTLGELAADPKRRKQMIQSVKGALGTYLVPGRWGTLMAFHEHKIPVVTEEAFQRLCAKLKYSPQSG